MSNKLKNHSALAAIVATCTALSIAIPADLPKWNGTALETFKAVREQLAPAPNPEDALTKARTAHAKAAAEHARIYAQMAGLKRARVAPTSANAGCPFKVKA